MDADRAPTCVGTAQPFRLTRRVGSVELRLAGEVDVATAPALVAAVEDAIAEDCRTIAVDLGEVTFMDAAGIGALVHAQGEMTARGGRLVLVSASRAARRTLQLTRMEAAFGLSELDHRVAGP